MRIIILPRYYLVFVLSKDSPKSGAVWQLMHPPSTQQALPSTIWYQPRINTQQTKNAAVCCGRAITGTPWAGLPLAAGFRGQFRNVSGLCLLPPPPPPQPAADRCIVSWPMSPVPPPWKLLRQAFSFRTGYEGHLCPAQLSKLSPGPQLLWPGIKVQGRVGLAQSIFSSSVGDTWHHETFCK